MCQGKGMGHPDTFTLCTGTDCSAMIDLICRKLRSDPGKNYPDQFEERRQGIERLADYGARLMPWRFLETVSSMIPSW